ncbi:MAG: hypothetical protein PVJ20_10350 [Desulfobacterales bacterium]|jgi:hypothetical protein
MKKSGCIKLTQFIYTHALPDRAKQIKYADIPTSLQLPEDTVDCLRQVASRILFGSEQFQKLVHDLGGKIPVSP